MMKVADRILITSKIIGNLAIGYHRTQSIENIFNIERTGFNAGSGDTYGEGIYLTYSLESQLNRNMEARYGEWIIKAKVDLHDYMIFDLEVAKKVYPNAWSIEDQAYNLGFSNKQIKEMTEQAEYHILDQRLTSSMAEHFYQDYIKNNQRKNKVRGLVFTGNTDGRVIVAYEPKSVIPFQYAYSSYRPITVGNNKEELDWITIDPKNAIKNKITLKKPNNTAPRLEQLVKLWAEKQKFKRTGRFSQVPMENFHNQKYEDQKAYIKEITPRFKLIVNPVVNYSIENFYISLIVKYLDYKSTITKYSLFISRQRQYEPSKKELENWLPQTLIRATKYCLLLEKIIDAGNEIMNKLYKVSDPNMVMKVDYTNTSDLTPDNVVVSFTKGKYDQDFRIEFTLEQTTHRITISLIEGYIENPGNKTTKLTYNTLNTNKIINDIRLSNFLK